MNEILDNDLTLPRKPSSTMLDSNFHKEGEFPGYMSESSFRTQDKQIPQRYRSAHVDDFATAHQPGAQKAIESARKFVKNGGVIVCREQPKYGLLVSGPCGTGKTHLATGVLRDLSRLLKVPFGWIDFYDMIGNIQGSYSKGNSADIIRPLQRYRLLLIDDLCDPDAAQLTADQRKIMYQILKSRNDNLKITLLTTNLNPTALRGQIGERSFERLIELCAMYTMEGDSIRQRM